MKKEFFTKWLSRESLKDCSVVKGVPGVGNISHISVDYLINKLSAKLVCRIYSNYLPSIVFIKDDSSLELPCYEVFYKSVKSKKLVFIRNNYPPTSEYYSYKINDYLADFIKKIGAAEVITIAGIAYKEMPKSIKLYSAVNTLKLKKNLENKGLIFDGNKSVSLIIGSAGLLLTHCAERSIPGFCILVSTWAHPNYLGIKESKKTIEWLSNYLKFNIDFTDLNQEIKRLNKESKKTLSDKALVERAEYNISRYIG